MNRRAYLHADSNATVGSTAVASVVIPATGDYSVLARYEAGFRFSSPFNISITQNGKSVYGQTYGNRHSPRVWGLAGCTKRYGGLDMLSEECRWNYGSTENMVWEGPSKSSNYTAHLHSGPATILLSVAYVEGDIAERNVDTLLLTQNRSDITMRLEAESRPLQIDGLIGTQEGEVFAMVENHADVQMNLTLPLTSDKSPEWKGKLVYPVVAEYRGKMSVISSCGGRGGGSAHYAPIPPAPDACEKCVANSTQASLHNCTPTERRAACDPEAVPNPNERDPACLACARQLHAAHNCTTTEAEEVCGKTPVKPDPESGCTKAELEHLKAQCVSTCTSKVVATLASACQPKEPKPPPPVPASASGCVTFVLRPKEKSKWTDVGRLIDTLNHAPWNLPAGNYTITLGLREPDASITTLGVFPSMNAPLQILMDASTRATRRVRARATDFWELHGNLSALKPKLVGKPPTEVPIFATTFNRLMPGGGTGPANGTGLPDPKYAAAQKEFEDMFPISPDNVGGDWRTEWGYLDLRGLVGRLGDSGPDTSSNGLQSTLASSEYTRSRALELKYNGVAVALDDFKATDDEQQPSMVSPPAGPTMKSTLQSFIDRGLGEKVRAIKLGDEISLPRPSAANNSADVGFHSWAKSKGLSAKDIGCDEFDAHCHYNISAPRGADPLVGLAQTNPALFYYSNLYANDFGIDSAYKNATAMISKMLPKALAGANYAPVSCRMGANYSCMAYLPETFKWIRAFRAGTFSLPFTEDYMWQQPPGSQQMYTQVIDVERAAVRKADPEGQSSPRDVAAAPLNPLPASAAQADRPIMQYMMAHFPGNTPRSWRRQFMGDLAHGVKYIHLYAFVPSFSSPANDYADGDGGIYQEVLRSTHELGQWDDILGAGKVHAAGVKVAMLFSETGDIFLDSYGTAGAAKRSLYVALSHSQLPMDVVTEEDLIDGTINKYSVLFVCHRYVNDDASTAVSKWVNSGGVVVSTVNGGTRNQVNATNAAFQSLLGLTEPPEAYAGTRSGWEARIDYIKQDLAFAEILDTASLAAETATSRHGYGMFAQSNLTVVGEKAIFKPPADATILARFGSDQGVAAYSRKVGNGQVFYFGFHVGLAYFFPAIPKRPVARGSNDECFNHWVPTEFDADARFLASLPTKQIVGVAPVLSSEPRVDIGVVAAAGKGTVIPVTNWAGAVVRGFNITLQFPCTFTTAKLASGGSINASKTASGHDVFVFDLDIAADAVILR
jgi:hypothetical protein